MPSIVTNREPDRDAQSVHASGSGQNDQVSVQLAYASLGRVRLTATISTSTAALRRRTGLPESASWAVVIRDRTGSVLAAVAPEGVDQRALHPLEFARAAAVRFGASVSTLPHWLDITAAEDGWSVVDTRKCKACGQLMGLPMCCDDPATKRHVMALGFAAPLVIRNNTTTTGASS